MVRSYSNTFALTVAPSGLPDFVPAPGRIGNISVNTIADVMPCSVPAECIYWGVEGIQGAFAWCGGGYIRSVDRFGRLCFWGGGHNAYYGNEGYEFSFETRSWRRIGEPSLVNGTHDAELIASAPWCNYADGKPAAPHTYSACHGLPPEWGGGPQGSLVNVFSAAAGQAALGCAGSYILSMHTQEWSRYSLNTAAGPVGFGPAVFDQVHGKFYVGCTRQASWQPEIHILDCATRMWTMQGCPGPLFTTWYEMAYCPPLDCLLFLERGAYNGASATDPHVYTVPCSNLAQGWTRRATNALPSNFVGGAMSINWADELGRFGIYNPGERTIVYLKAPATIDGTWEWGAETFGGEEPVYGGGGGYDPSYNRMQWVGGLKSWAWYALAHGPVQLWRTALV
jgi:hypothetical protein